MNNPFDHKTPIKDHHHNRHAPKFIIDGLRLSKKFKFPSKGVKKVIEIPKPNLITYDNILPMKLCFNDGKLNAQFGENQTNNHGDCGEHDKWQIDINESLKIS